MRRSSYLVLVAGLCFAQAQKQLAGRFPGTAGLSLVTWCLMVVALWWAVGALSRSQSLVAPELLGMLGFRSEVHTSELQSHSDLVCRLLLEKKNKQ